MASLPVSALFSAPWSDTMQNGMDNMLSKAPGYRDRIVHISHTKDEGGLNLDMVRPDHPAHEPIAVRPRGTKSSVASTRPQ